MARLYCSFLSVSALEKKWGYLEISSVQPSAATLKSAGPVLLHSRRTVLQ